MWFAPSTVSEGPIPSKLMLESSVVFLPRFLGTDRDTAAGLLVRSRRARCQGGMSPALIHEDEPLSGLTTAATITRQVALSNSLRSAATPPLFARSGDAGYGAAHGGAAHRQSAHGLYVVATLLKSEVGMCSWRSALRSLLAFCSSFGRDPGLFFGAKDSPWSAFFT